MSAFDPKRTSTACFRCDAQAHTMMCYSLVLGVRAVHETARVHRNCRRCGSMAARGACAAEESSVNWIYEQPSPEDSQSVLTGFRKGLNEGGIVEGKDAVID